MPKYNRNKEKNGLEISFEGIPEESVRTQLKEADFRWHRDNKYWYEKETAGRLALVEQICGESAKTAGTTEMQKPAAAQTSAPPVVKSVMNRRCCYSNSMQGFLSEKESN